MPAIGLDVDDEDGGPLWDVRRGTPLVPGQLAWARLAVGHHCEVWLCWSVDLWVPTLVKVVRPAWTRPRWTRALGREAAALRPLRHPAFPRLLADGGRSELPHLVLEYLDGPALDQALAEEGPLPAPDTARLGVGLLAAVRSLHGSGRTHLDICPGNVLLVDRRVRLVDLGSSRPLGRVLRRGELVGTDGFAAPELLAGHGGPVTAAMGVYGVGATLRALLDPETDTPLRRLLDAMTRPDPDGRPSVDESLARLVRHAGHGTERPWPRWADAGLARDARRRPPATVPA
ncbi:MAG TPA: protein kinase [Blastococcus sp.]|nr:protein kinase [Blastococcus sp.]